MQNIESFSYQCGVIDCFNEMVCAGVKNLALSHPLDSAAERDALLPFTRESCNRYGNQFYIEDEPLLTDLFPISMNKGKFNAIFYQEDSVLEEYLSLKAEKRLAWETGSYTPEKRRDIAWRYGKLLSYTDEGIERLLAGNQEKE